MTVIFTTHKLHPDVTTDLQALAVLRIASAPTPGAIDLESGGADIIVVRAPIAAGIVQREPNLRACVRHGAGLDMIPVDVATKSGVLVANVPGANAITVAEHVIWSALALLRQHPRVRANWQANGWEAGRQHSDAGRELSGKTLGVIGMGNVGRALFGIAKHGLGMRVIAHTRTPANVPDGAEAVDLATLLDQSDILVLCCPLNDQTRGLLSREAIALMKSGAVLVNVSRGPVVAENALLDALQSGHLGGAAIDVFDEQPLRQTHPFMALNNVILTPHMAGITEESMLRMGQGVVKAVRQILSGGLPDTLCNPDAVPAYRARFDI